MIPAPPPGQDATHLALLLRMPDPIAPIADALLRGALIALLLLLAVHLLRHAPSRPAAKLGAALCAGQIVQAVETLPLMEATAPGWLLVPLVAISVGNAVLFWLFVWALFDDDFRFAPWQGAVWLAAAGLAGVNCAVAVGGHTQGAWFGVSMVLQRVLPLVFAALALAAGLRHWRGDLVDERRRLRGFILVTGCMYSVAMLTARVASPGGMLSPQLAMIDAAWMLVIAGFVAWNALGLRTSALLGAAPPPRETLTPALPLAGGGSEARATGDEAVDQPWIDKLERHMRERQPYRRDDLSLDSLAAELGLPAYRLRRLINQRLGHRNFNAFVNGYRLDEARSALVDRERGQLPVLSIALDSGFGSIGPFNRAFKHAYGLTPTEFRARHRADS